MTDRSLEADIATMRHFNRFYTQRIGVLRQGLLQSRFSLTEARLLFELAHRSDSGNPGRGDELAASQLCRELDLDPGYVSRILKRFERAGLLRRRAAPRDARRSLLAITPKGRAAFAPLDKRSRAEIAGLVKPLGEAGRRQLIAAMARIESLLGGQSERPAPYTLRSHKPGDIGWVISRHGSVYAEEFGWDITFEAMVAEIAAKFLREFKPEREACWIAERDTEHGPERIGSVFVVEQSKTVAKLRMLVVDAAARGLGLGNKLVETCEDFARAKGYRKMVLWTNANLLDARRIYEKRGFKLVSSEPHHSFGKDLVGEYWEKPL